MYQMQQIASPRRKTDEAPLVRPLRYMLLSAYPFSQYSRGPQWLMELSGPCEHVPCDSPDDAEVIIFVESHPPCDPYFFTVLRHPIRRQFPDKCVLYQDADLSVTLMRTLSPSVEKWQMPVRFVQPFHYFARLCENEVVNRCTMVEILDDHREYLCSFVGSSRTNRIREQLFDQRVPSSFYHNTGEMRGWELDEATKHEYETTFVAATLHSHFVLCPRGCGPSTYRLYEVMRLGRAPVIISDQWVPPAGADWESFCLRIPEHDVGNLENTLRSSVDRAKEMGTAARQAWEQFFSPQVTLKRLVEEAYALTNIPCTNGQLFRACCQFLTPHHARGFGRYLKRRGKELTLSRQCNNPRG